VNISNVSKRVLFWTTLDAEDKWRS